MRYAIATAQHLVLALALFAAALLGLALLLLQAAITIYFTVLMSYTGS